MKARNRIFFSHVLLAVVFLLVAIASGCQKSGGVKLGVDIPRDVAVTKLAAVLEDPAAYDGKSIVMKGIVSGQCASFCEFYFSDGPHTVTIFPQGYQFPKLEKGKSVTVYTRITSGAEQVAVSALGLTMN
jgi:hypothetical protein